MFAISEVIYGIPLVSNDAIVTYSEELENFIDEEWTAESGVSFLSFYSGSGDQSPAAFGIQLDQFDEGCSYVNISDLTLIPSQEHVSQFKEAFEELSDDLKAELSKFEGPRVFFLWSTS